MAKDKYEISLWDDIFVSASGTIPGHYEEQRIAIIGSDSMTAQCRAIEPKFVQNINGKNTLTFKMFYTYHDELTGENYQNPFLNLLVNERKVKVNWYGNWYDLIIKNIQESSNGKSVVYTCEDANINELAKSGFEIEFDDELNDEEFTNQGTAQELVAATLSGTDWTLDEDNSDTIQQSNEEPTFEFVLTAALSSVTDQTTGQTGVTIPSGATILVYYSQLQILYDGDVNRVDLPKLQFAYAAEYSREVNSELVVNAHCYEFANNSTYCEKINSQLKLHIGNMVLTCGAVSDRYRAKRLIESIKMVKDSLTGKTCYVYKALSNGSGDYTGKISANDIIYKYVGSDFGTANYITNIVANSNNFLSTDGWNGDDTHLVGFTIYPISNNALPEHSYITIPAQSNAYVPYYNDGMRANSQYFSQGVVQGEQYVVRIKAKTDLSSANYAQLGNNLKINPEIRQWYFPESSNYRQPLNNGIVYFSAASSSGTFVDDWIEFTFECKNSFSGADIYSKRIGFFLNIQTATQLYIEEVQLFKYITDKNNTRINPGEFDKEGIVKTVYTYYNFTKASTALDGVNNLTEYELYKGTSDWNGNIGSSTIEPVKNENFVKIRSISVKNSNRFNILQSIAETFQCWIKFIVPHDAETGQLIYVNGVPTKKVRILNSIGVERNIGFIYGIDLQTIQRTIESNSIVTKTIVKANSNQYAENGTCRISRSEFNIPRTDFIYNFDYYINHSLLDGTELNKDLYLKTIADEAAASVLPEGYYYWMNKWNLEYESLALLIAKYQITVLESEARLKAFSTAADAANDTVINYQRQICNLAKLSDRPYTDDEVKKWINNHKEEAQVQPILAAIVGQTNLRDQYLASSQALTNSISSYSSEINNFNERKNELEHYIKTKSTAFYKKYARFISEGSWIDEKYSDDNLYFLDATSVAYTSSRPKVTYNISVLRLTGLEGYEVKDFALGDIAFVQDTEFFGYTYPIINNIQIKTPYKEQVLISEITYNFDDPSQDSFKVQNYKTQFEDLFQRIAATTQNLQYANGSYEKAAGIVETDGTINTETLTASIAVNANVLNHTSLNQSVITDEQGVTVTDLTDPARVVRITAGGVFISTDGGNTWKNAVRGEGVATQYLTAGSINTSIIQIMDGEYSAFRWDMHGISAYDAAYDSSTPPRAIGYNLGKFVRFDHFGIYGIDQQLASEYSPLDEDQIWDDAKFGLTWEGFFVKNKYSNHYVEVSSKNDIAVVDTSGAADIDRVKIGKLDDNSFGIQLKDSTGLSVMRTDSSGQLWLDNALYVSRSNSNYDVAIGALPSDSYAVNSAGAKQVINSTDKFIVYEDGSMRATDAYFEGTGSFTGAIYATSGKIGNLEIGDIETSVYQVRIESNSGTIFRPESSDKILTAKLYKGNSEVTNGTKTYQWLLDGYSITGATSATYTVMKSTFGDNAVHTYDCIITYTPPTGG